MCDELGLVLSITKWALLIVRFFNIVPAKELALKLTSKSPIHSVDPDSVAYAD